MKFRFLFLSFSVGFLSLGEEIAWVRIVSFLEYSVPQSFAFVLFLYISGIAFGALVGGRWARKNLSPGRVISVLLLCSGVFVVLSPSIIAVLYGSDQFLLLAGVCIAFGAALKGAIFPLVHHWFSRPGANLGKSLSWVYFANVMGSALGPVLVGFYLLDYFSMYTALVILGSMEVLIALMFCVFSYRQYSVFAFGVAAVFFPLLDDGEEILKHVISYQHIPGIKITNLIENKHGVIYTLRDDLNAVDLVYGGNVYDGGFNVDLSSDVNGITRAYMLAGLHPKPSRVLFIGLSSGSWLRVVAAMPDIKSIDVVEINPGYTDLIRRYDGHSDILSDDRVNIVYTDGRKWLERAAAEGKHYDLIVMNNTWHWRAYSTNLLSYEFMSMLRSVLNKGGVTTFNTTWSMDVFYTASRAFSKAYIYKNFVYASDRDLNEALSEYGDRFCELDSSRIDGQSCRDADFRSKVEKLKNIHLLNWNEVPKNILHGRPAELVTDDNMIVEYRYGRGLNVY